MRRPQLAKDLRDVPRLQKLLKSRPESFWQKRGEAMALQLFHDMAEHVPAYKDFLAKRQINHRSVKTIADFQQVPTISKDSYLRQYPLADLCFEGSFRRDHWVVSSTSGSTGEPFYFPRTDLQDEQYALTAELYLRENFHIQDKSTLYIDAFAMGVWIGGLFTYEAVHRVAQKGYNLTIITPGINKGAIIDAVRRLGPQFDQIIIGSYPPMLRDIIELGIEHELDWGDYNLGVVFSAEGFSEGFRDYIAKHAKLANIYTSTLNHYGTVDLGTMSHETPLSIMVRRQATQDQPLFHALFGSRTKQPTLTQYLPELFYFEAQDDQVICSSYSGLPLVRYDLQDIGGVISLGDVTALYKEHHKDLDQSLKQAEIAANAWNLPFVYVFERNDFSVNLVGGIVYPEEIRKALLSDTLPTQLTGKFTMEVVHDSKLRPKLVIHAELKRDKASSTELSRQAQKAIVDTLLEENTEYRSNYGSYGRKLWPRIRLWPYEHPLHFSGQGKQKWVKK